MEAREGSDVLIGEQGRATMAPPESAPEPDVGIKRLIDEGFHFVVIAGLSACGKSTMLASLLASAARPGSKVSRRPFDMRHPGNRFMTEETFNLAQPGLGLVERTGGKEAFEVLSVMEPHDAKLPTVRFAFMEAGGEVWEDVFGGALDPRDFGRLPPKVAQIAADPDAKVSWIFVCSSLVIEARSMQGNPDAKLSAALTLIHALRGDALKRDHLMLLLTHVDRRSDPTFDSAAHANRTLPQLSHALSIYPYARVRPFSAGKFVDGKLVQLTGASPGAVLHWLYKAATGRKLDSEIDPDPPPPPPRWIGMFRRIRDAIAGILARFGTGGPAQ